MIDLARALEAVGRALEYDSDAALRRVKSGYEYDGPQEIQTTAKADGLWLVCLDSEKADYRKYSGEAVLVLIDGTRSKVLLGPFPFSSHPGQISTAATGTPDVDGDGRRDVAWALEGVVYTLRGKRNKSDRFDPVDKYQPVLRNMNGERTYDDVVRYSPRWYPATAIQYHAGSSSKPISVGCFTSPPDSFKAVAQRIESLNVSSWRLVFEHKETYEDA